LFKKPKSKRVFRGLAGSPLAEIDHSLIDKPIPLPTPEESEKSAEERRGVKVYVSSNRYLFKPPLSVENIAMFLSMPEVLFLNYEKCKGNPPAESIPTFSPIHTDALPPKQRRGKLLVPTKLYDDLAQLKTELRTTLSAKHSKKLDGGLRGDDLEKARRSNKREQQKIEKKIASYDKWTKVDIPGTGRPSFTIQIPPCPKGCRLFFENPALKKSVREYIKTAWGRSRKEDSAAWDWDFHYNDFEDQVVRRALAAGIFCLYPNELAFTKLIDVNPTKWELPRGETAADKAKWGYTDFGNKELAELGDDGVQIRLGRPHGHCSEDSREDN
jgi:hypothetical protein